MEGIEDPAEFVRKAKVSADVERARDAVVEAARSVSPSGHGVGDLRAALGNLDAAEAKARKP
jgi:hypothetical protein